MTGSAESAYRLWRTFCPVLRGTEPDRYVAEPYVTPGNVDGPTSAFPGRAGWSWYSGSAQWYLRAMIEGILGVRATLDGLSVDTQLPKEWDHFSLTRNYRGARYEITVRRAAQGEQPGCTVNKEPWTKPVLPIAPADSVQQVEIKV
jgi:cellobiose phosphorylase